MFAIAGPQRTLIAFCCRGQQVVFQRNTLIRFPVLIGVLTRQTGSFDIQLQMLAEAEKALDLRVFPLECARIDLSNHKW